MRLTADTVQIIREQVLDVAGAAARVSLFGSRTNAGQRGGDIDLLVELPDPVARPAQLSALLSARISRSLDGRQVDVLIAAPNLLQLPIHEHARRSGILL